MFYSLPAETNAYENIVAAIRGMHVSPAKHSYCMRDYQESVTTGQTDTRTHRQTDAGQSDHYVPLCLAGDTINELQNLTFYWIMRIFHWTSATDMACQHCTRESYSCGHLIPSHLGLACNLLVESETNPFSPSLTSPDFELRTPLKMLSQLYLQNLQSSTFCHQIHVQILLNLVIQDNTDCEWYVFIHLVISDRRFADITLSLFVKHVLYTLKNVIFYHVYICHGLVHRLSTLKLLLFMTSKEWTMSIQNLSG